MALKGGFSHQLPQKYRYFQEFIENQLLGGLFSNFTYMFIGVWIISANCFTSIQTIAFKKYMYQVGAYKIAVPPREVGLKIFFAFFF